MPNLKRIFSRQNILFLVIFLIFVNLLYLDYLIYRNGGIKSETKTIYQTTNNPASDQTTTPSLTGSPTPTPTVYIPSSLQSTNTQAAKEYYVPFGSGSSSSTDWQDVPGMQAYIDSTAYQNISQVTFEASAHIPTGNQTASVRLVNATDGRAITGSELTFNGNTSSVLLSGTVNLDYAKKLYKIQMKTQLGYQAILDQARVHITTK